MKLTKAERVELTKRASGRFEAERLAGLFSRHKGSKATTLTPALEARILDAHTPGAFGRVHVLEHPQASWGVDDQSYGRGPGLGQTWAQATSAGALHRL